MWMREPTSFGVGVGELAVDLEGGIELIVGEEGLAECAEGADVTGIDIDGALVGGDGVLGVLELIVGRAEGELHLGGAVLDGDGFDYFDGVLDVAALNVEAGEVEDNIFGVGVDGLRGLELVFGFLEADA